MDLKNLEIRIRLATVRDVDLVVPLFCSYRQFYNQKSDLELAKKFISERLKNKQSVIFIALLEKIFGVILELDFVRLRSDLTKSSSGIHL
jgi:hypothetical protein